MCDKINHFINITGSEKASWKIYQKIPIKKKYLEEFVFLKRDTDLFSKNIAPWKISFITDLHACIW